MNHTDRVVFDALFAPQTVALVGASTDARKHTSRPQRALKRHGFTGRIVPINRQNDEVFGDRAYASLLDVPHEIDHAFVMVPPGAVPNVLEECIERRVPVVTIYTDGFAEAGDHGRLAQEALVRRAREGGVRILGPNCMGLVSTASSTVLSTNAALEQLDIPRGPLSVISQSGSMTGGLLSRGLGRGAAFAKVVSIGNESDLTVGEIADWLADDPETGAILLFLETIRDSDRLAAAARRALDAGKPVIAYKLGRSDVGRSIAASHTGAIAGGDAAAQAFFQAHGILRVTNLEALFELPALVMHRQPAARHRIAVMSTTGGGAALVADNLGVMGVEVVPPSEQVVESLAEQGIAIPTGPLTDLTHAGTRTEIYRAVLGELVRSDHCDLVLAVGGSSAQFQPEVAVDPMIEVVGADKPVAAFLAPNAEIGLARLTEAGAAAFRTPEACADAIAAWSRWTMPSQAAPVEEHVLSSIRTLVDERSRQAVNEVDATRLLATLGVSMATSIVLGPDATEADLEHLEYPVVAKVLSADIPHKTEAGGVVLGIEGPSQLMQAIEQITRNVSERMPDARVDGILVQEMHEGLAQVILGFRRDPEAGPIVVLGMGGVLAEITRDVAIRVAPTNLDEARAMIEEVTGLATIRGYRGMPLGDLDALAQAVVAMSQLGRAELSAVLEAEINPLLVRPEQHGVVGVDGLIVFDRAATPASEQEDASA